jgi:acetylornithine deacetylase/succinyl-diaminopimelate desuccinylase-like protein
MGLRGDVIFAGVADEEAMSIGTEQVLEAGWRADSAIVTEPTDLELVAAHQGFVWLEVDIHGVAAHGSLPDIGVDAISKAGYFLVQLDKYGRELQRRKGAWKTGPPSVHASVIRSGVEESSYPASCHIKVERRTVSGETAESVRQEVQTILERIASSDPDFKFELEVTFQRPPFELSAEDPFATLVGQEVGKSLGKAPAFVGKPFWTDCALLSKAGIPTLLWGPRDGGLHGKEEWVDTDSIAQVSRTLAEIASRFCS